MALLLRKQGVSRIRPLAGGFPAWLERGFPVEPLANGRTHRHVRSPGKTRGQRPTVTIPEGPDAFGGLRAIA